MKADNDEKRSRTKKSNSVQIQKRAVGTVTFELVHVDLDQRRLNKLEKLFNETLKKVKNVL